MSLNVGNCPKCGKLYVKGVKDVCPACMKEIDEQFHKCFKFLREHRGATLYDLSEATEVTVKQITKFIREGRISLADSPNMGYPCEVCGGMTRESALCDSCRERLSRDVNRMNEDEKRKTEKSNEAPNQAGHSYKIKDR